MDPMGYGDIIFKVMFILIYCDIIMIQLINYHIISLYGELTMM